MESLKNKTCEVCRVGAPQVSPQEMTGLLPQVPDWEFMEMDGVNKLQRIFRFEDFQKALDFTHRVGELSESEGHHPAILTEWGKVTVTWWTHKINGLHMNDFIMAAKTDQIYSNNF